MQCFTNHASSELGAKPRGAEFLLIDLIRDPLFRTFRFVRTLLDEFVKLCCFSQKVDVRHT